jgi:FlaA1/EpsC-like NDP-sugar epimerase
MENCPYEAVRNNIFGTYNVLMAAKKFRCSKFVLISTDKAINPTNVMGATKRYCELMVRAMACQSDCETDYVAVRFGNVLGSHGSVLPLFQMQLEHGGPITVTDKRMTRYFMTIPEAAGLVIKAAAMANRSEVFILDMGKPVKIIDLAENFVKLSGYEPYTEIPIIETGLRPGEKLYEELLINDRDHKSTSTSKIFIEKNLETVSLDDIKNGMGQLKVAADIGNDENIIRVLRKLVPTFKTPEEVNGKFDSSEAESESRQPYRYSEPRDVSFAHSGS